MIIATAMPTSTMATMPIDPTAIAAGERELFCVLSPRTTLVVVVPLSQGYGYGCGYGCGYDCG